MSGGVDSSVVAAMLAGKGHDLVGIFMKFWEESLDSADVKFDTLTMDSAQNKCCDLDAYEGARRIAHSYGFPLYTLNFRKTFKEKVVDDFIRKYQSGLTPNPCLNCNQFVKFGEFLNRADELGCDAVATGHYARIRKESDGSHALLRGIDEKKDQSYFMYHFTQSQMKRILFPLGNFRKTEVRKLAEDYCLPTAKKPDSQEVCFYKEKDQYPFLKRHLVLVPGDILDSNGHVVGKHDGLPLYTLGQRKGIKLGGIGPMYVVGLNYDDNILEVSYDRNDPKLFSKTLVCESTNWIDGKLPILPMSVICSIRYHHREPAFVMEKLGDGRYRIEFDSPQRAVMPGQSAVFYKGEKLIGGGVIVESLKNIAG